MEIAKNNSREF